MHIHKTIIEQALNDYVDSVNELNLDAARDLWLDAPSVSFIHPRGHEIGLENIIKSFYVDTMGRFSKRDLRRTSTNIEVYGQTAIATFDWDFEAIFLHDGSPLVTHGRETQVFVWLNENTWKLAHVHYSSIKEFNEREGF